MTDSNIDGVRDAFQVATRINRAVGLRRDGWTYQSIAEACGYADRGAAHHAVMGRLRANIADHVNELRTLENERFDADELVLRLIIDDPKVDVRVRLRAIDCRTRVSARRSRLNGLDLETRAEISTGVREQLDAGLAALRAALYGPVFAEEPTESAAEPLGSSNGVEGDTS
jgi:hypothetical protein